MKSLIGRLCILLGLVLLVSGYMVGGRARNVKKVYVCADVEGSWQKVYTFVEKCNGMLTIVNDDPDNFQTVLQDNVSIVFLGDTVDKGPDNIKALKFFIHLKETYQDRVVLIMGNRDINKLRLLWELEDGSLDLQGEDRFALDKFRLSSWEDNFAAWLQKGANLIDGIAVPYTHGKDVANDKILKLKWLLQNTFGAPAAFDDFKKEVGAESDQEAYDKYMTIMLGQDGLIIKYLRLAQMIHFDADTKALIVHGGISSDSFGYIPETRLGAGDFYQCIFEVPHKSMMHTAIAWVYGGGDTLTSWIDRLNAWAQDRIGNALDKDVLGALPLIQHQEPEISIKDGKQVWTTPKAISVIHGRPWGEDYNIIPVDRHIADMLKAFGVSKLLFGHSPVGEVPVILKDNRFITIACDTSVASPARNAAVELTSHGVTVYADYYSAGERHSVMYGSGSFSVGTKVEVEGKVYWRIASLGNNKVLVGHWARSPRGPWSEPAYSVFGTSQ